MDGRSAGTAARFGDLTGCRVPIQAAVMGGASTPELAGAVSREGGLGMCSGTLVTPDELVSQIDQARAIAGGDAVIGVGFLMPFLDPEAWDAAVDHAAVVEGFYGDPDAELIRRAHARDTLVSWQVGSLAEARLALAVECDLIVVQGTEAGGHVRGSTALDDLLAAVRPLTDAPVVATGGIGTPVRAAELLAAGADAVRIGTRLLATAEADVHPGYLAALAAAEAEDTELTETFALAWPNAPHRVLRSCVDASADDPATRSPLPPGRDFTGDVATAALYAGKSVGAVTGATTVAEVMAEFADVGGGAPPH